MTGSPLPDDGTKTNLTAPASFSFLAPAYGEKYGVEETKMKEVLTRIAWKNHYNGARNERAQFQKEVSKETISNAPLIAGQLGVFDCSGVSDGSRGRHHGAGRRRLQVHRQAVVRQGVGVHCRAWRWAT